MDLSRKEKIMYLLPRVIIDKTYCTFLFLAKLGKR
jgi:hypothetical protein